MCLYARELFETACWPEGIHVKTNKHVHMDGFMCTNGSSYMFVSVQVCVCMYVCLQSAGFGTVARQGDHFQPAGDLTLICSMLMTAAGLRPPRAEQTWLN